MLRGTRRSKVMKNRQKRIAGRWAFFLIWLRRFGLGLAIVTGLVWTGAWLWLSGSVHKAANWTTNQIILASGEAGFTVENIYIEGRVYADAVVLKSLIDLEAGDPLFGADVDHIQDKISQMAWVGDVVVERRLPDTLYIKLEERVPVARYKAADSDRMVVLDQYGQSITDYKLSRFEGLLLVSGEHSAKHAPQLVEFIHAEPDVEALTLYAKRISDRRWDLKFRSGVLVKLPEGDIGFALKKLARAQRDNQILERDLAGIDLRDPERIILQTKPGQTQHYKARYSSSEKSL